MVTAVPTTSQSYLKTERCYAYDYIAISDYRARYYDPSIGRFISEDPIGFAGSGTNFYAYVKNDPINLTDPLGLCPKDKATECRIKVGLGIGLDVAGTVAGLVPGAGAALVTTQVSLGLASSAYSAYNGKVGFTIGNATGAKLSAIAGMAAQTAGWETAAKALPWVGTIYNAGALGWDVWHANSDYQACMAAN